MKENGRRKRERWREKSFQEGGICLPFGKKFLIEFVKKRTSEKTDEVRRRKEVQG